jgi:hypothetical protein
MSVIADSFQALFRDSGLIQRPWTPATAQNFLLRKPESVNMNQTLSPRLCTRFGWPEQCITNISTANNYFRAPFCDCGLKSNYWMHTLVKNISLLKSGPSNLNQILLINSKAWIYWVQMRVYTKDNTLIMQFPSMLWSKCRVDNDDALPHIILARFEIGYLYWINFF